MLKHYMKKINLWFVSKTIWHVMNRFSLLMTSLHCDYQVKEIFSFTQDDLTTEDIFILDCYTDIYVWIGSQSNVKSKQQALLCGQVNNTFSYACSVDLCLFRSPLSPSYSVKFLLVVFHLYYPMGFTFVLAWCTLARI